MPNTAGPVVVIGSINMDLVCRTPRLPAAGETILGSDFLTIPGGKGANQAVAAAKLANIAATTSSAAAGADRVTKTNTTGPEVYLVGRVGGDDFGQRLLNGLTQHNVHTDFVTITEASSSGVALIVVNRTGENSIIVAPGANSKLSPADVDAARSVIATASVVVLQLEIPLETVRRAIAVCQEMGVFTILDPAPVPPRGLSRALMGVDVLAPNQTEAQAILGTDGRPSRVRRKMVIDPKQLAMGLLLRGPRAVVMKLGPKGAMSVDRSGEIRRFRPHKVKVVDTTAAGDAFTGALAVAHAEGKSFNDAVEFANVAGALCCRSFGAQPSLPGRAEVERLLAKR